MSKTVPIDSIVIPKDRARKDLGDIEALAASIEQVGLLQPVVLDKNNRLIAGRRRIEAMRKLNCDDVRAVVVDGLEDAVQALKAERDENTCRKDFEPEEAIRLGMRLLTLEQPAAAERKRAGIAADGSGGRGHKKPSGTVPEGFHEKNRSRERVGAAIAKKRPDIREVYVRCIHAWNAFRRGDATALRYYKNAPLPKFAR